MKTRPLVVPIFLAVAACSSSNDATDTSSDPNVQAKAEFWNAFNGGDVAAVPAARDHLVATLDAHPTDDETPRLIGMSYALTQMEGTGGGAPAIPQGGAPDMLKYLKMATEAPPDPDRKVWNYTFYGGVLWGQGSFTHDAASAEQGRQMLALTAQKFPIHGLYTEGSVYARSARLMDEFQTGLDAYYKAFEICTGKPLDRDRPDVSGMLHGPFPDPVCGNMPKIPHNLQGELSLFADMLVKNLQPDAARAVFEAIKQSDDFASWSFAKQVDERLSEDLVARGAAFGDPHGGNDPTKEPSIGASPCLGCHQR
jgi:hypothetical protein